MTLGKSTFEMPMSWSMRGLLCSTALLSVLALPSHASADDWKFSLGAGVGAAPDYEGSDDYEAVPIILARAQQGHRYLDLVGTTLRANLIGSPVFSAGPVINYRGERDDVESDAVDDLDNVDEAIELGAFLGFTYQGMLARISVTQDVNDAHEGMLVELVGGYQARFSPTLALTTTVTGTWADDDYMDTYFGIDDGDAAASGLDEFEAEEGFKDVGVGLRLAWGGGTGWGMTGIASYKRLLNDAEDSPVVDDVGDENQLFAGVAVTYGF